MKFEIKHSKCSSTVIEAENEEIAIKNYIKGNKNVKPKLKECQAKQLEEITSVPFLVLTRLYDLKIQRFVDLGYKYSHDGILHKAIKIMWVDTTGLRTSWFSFSGELLGDSQ